MNITPQTLALIVAICTLMGGLVGSFAAIVTTLLNKRSEERKHLRQLVVNAAIEDWKQQIEQYKIHQQPVPISPLDIYIVRMVKLSEVILTDKVTSSNVEQKLKEVDEMTSQIMKYKKESSASKQRRA